MKPLHDRLNDRLERIESRSWQNGHSPNDFMLQERGREGDPEIDALVMLAGRLRMATHVQVDPSFARQLERRMLHRHVELRLQHNGMKRPFFFLFHIRSVLGVVLCLCLLLLGLGSGVLALAAQISDPQNQFYALKRWEQHLQISLTSNAGDQASLDLQGAQDRLKTLPTLAASASTGAYRQALVDLEQQVQTATAAINGLPPGTQRSQLNSELAGLRSDAIHILHSLLPRLTLSKRLATTSELAQLGDNVPQLMSGLLILPPHSHGPATISLSGSNLQPGSQLLIDGQSTGVIGLIRNGQLIFVVVSWKSEEHPQSLGFIGPDGTAAETTALTITATDGTTTRNGTHTGQGKGQQPTAIPGIQQDGQSPCPGLSQAQKLANKYQLSSDSRGAAIQAICALHQGTFIGTTNAGTQVTASRAYGYGEIDQLLTYAQYLASQDHTNAGGKLSDTNVNSYLAAALLNCVSAPLQNCLQKQSSTDQPGNHNGQGQGNGHLPMATPTPHH